MKSTPLFCVAAAAFVGLTVSCSTGGKTVYEPSQTGVIMKEKVGQVMSVRDVIIKPPDNGGIFNRGNPGANVGGAVGRAAATGESVGVAVAGIAGEEVGRAIGGQFDLKAAEEISIKLDEGDEMITIVQERSTPPLAPGERIKILVPTRTTAGSAISALAILRGAGSTGGGVRVVRDPDYPGSHFARETQIAQSRFAPAR
jgi:outer membrane lipoprotein SlyB